MTFKFLSATYARSQLSGTFRFGRLRYYQLLEYLYDDPYIGDANDGVATTIVNAKITSPEDPLARRLEQVAIIGPGISNAKISFQNVKLINDVDCFAFCCTARFSDEIAREMYDSSGYDRCIRIAGRQVLANHIWKSGVVQELNGRYVKDVFTRIAHGRIQYCQAEGDIRDGPAVPANPFVKLPRYTSQCEYRYALFPRQPLEFDALTIVCESAAILMTEYLLPERAAERSHHEKSGASLDATLSQLQTVIKRYQLEMHAINEMYRSVDHTPQAWKNALSNRDAAHAKFKVEQEHEYMSELHRCYAAIRKFNGGEPGIDRAIISRHPLHGLATLLETALARWRVGA